jgi:hypothetical protein
MRVQRYNFFPILQTFSKNIRNFAAEFSNSAARMGCTSAKSELSALGLHHS